MVEKKDIQFLVVDDFEYIRELAKKYLHELGYKDVILAKDGVEAKLKLQKTDGIGCIICDWNMPNMDGLELLIWVRAQEQTKAIPFIMVTGEAEKSNLITAVKEGVTKYIVKPFSQNIIEKTIHAVFEKNQGDHYDKNS